MTDTHYFIISNATYVCPVNTSILHIPNNSTRIAANVSKRDLDEHVCVFHALRGVEQAIIQHVVV